MKILVAQINPIVGDVEGNKRKIIAAIEKGKNEKADIILLPEMCLSGYPPDDFLLLPHFLNAIENALDEIQKSTKGVVAIVGTPRRCDTASEKRLYNSAAVFSDGSLLGFQDKSLLPTYDVFYERRYFEPASAMRVWDLCGKKVAITICEDIWQHSGLLTDVTYKKDPVKELKALNPDLLLNLSASPFSLSKEKKRLQVCAKTALTLSCPVILCNQVGGNDELIFDGHSLYVSEKGKLLDYAEGFKEEFCLIDLNEKKEECSIVESEVELLHNALVLGLRDYFHKSGFSKACLGLSGGIDSAVVAALAVEALGAENVYGVIMPSQYSSKDSVTDALALAKNLNIKYEEIPIKKPFDTYLETLSSPFKKAKPDVTEENLQARIRGTILMALSNKFGYIVLSTGNKSELGMGYATLYGDMCGGLGVLSDVKKNQVYALAQWINRCKEFIPQNTIQKPPSAELRPNQKDSDSLPSYDIIDNVLLAYVENHLSPEKIAKQYHYPLELVNELVHKIHCSEYKRRQSPPGLRITEKAFIAGRRFPIVQRWA